MRQYQQPKDPFLDSAWDTGEPEPPVKRRLFGRKPVPAETAHGPRTDGPTPDDPPPRKPLPQTERPRARRHS